MIVPECCRNNFVAGSWAVHRLAYLLTSLFQIICQICVSQLFFLTRSFTCDSFSSTYREKADFFVVADSFGRGAFIFALSVIASLHFYNKSSFFSASVSLLVTSVPPNSFLFLSSCKFILFKVLLLFETPITRTKKGNLT